VAIAVNSVSGATFKKLAGSAPILVAKPASLALPPETKIVPKPITLTPTPQPPKPVESVPVVQLPKATTFTAPKPVVVIEPAKPGIATTFTAPKPVVVIEPAKPSKATPEILKATSEPVLDFIKKPVTKLTNYVIEESIDKVARKAVEKGVDTVQVAKGVATLRNYIDTDASFKKKLNEVYNAGTATVTTALVGLAAGGAGAAGLGAGAGGAGAGGGVALSGAGGSSAAAAVSAVGSAAAAISKLGGNVSPGQQTEPENFYEENNAKQPTSEKSGGGLGIAAGLAALFFAFK
jgi:hypothetical protein